MGLSIQEVISCLLLEFWQQTFCIRETTKEKFSFFSGQSTAAFTPPSPRLSGQKNGYKFEKKEREEKKRFFSFLDNPVGFHNEK